MATLRWIICAALGVVISGCGGPDVEILDDGSKLSPLRAYLLLRDQQRDPHRIVDLEDPDETAHVGPASPTIADIVVLDDGSMLYFGSDRIERFNPDGTTTVLREGCDRGLLVAAAVYPDSQKVVHACREVFGNVEEVFEDSELRGACPQGQELLAAGHDGTLLCSQAIIPRRGPLVPFDLGAESATAVRAVVGGGFRIATGSALHLVNPDGRVEQLGAYPPLPATIGDRPLIAEGSVRPRQAALVEDGTYYQLALLGGPSGSYELFKHRLGDPSPISLTHLLPATRPHSLRLATGP